MSEGRIGVAQVAASAVILAFFPVLIRYLEAPFGLMGQVAIRSTSLALLAGTVGALRCYFIRRLRVLRVPPPAWGVAIGYAGSVVAFTVGVTLIPVGSAIFFLFAVSTAIAFGYDLSSGVIDRKSWALVLAFATCMTGVGLASTASVAATHSVAGVGLCVFAGVGEGVANVSRSRLDPAFTDQALLLQGLCALAVSVLPMGLGFGRGGEASTTHDWLLASLFGVALYVVGRLLVGGFGRLQSSRGTQVLALEIPAAALIGFAVYGERVPESVLLGGLLLIVSLGFRRIADRAERAESIKEEIE